MSLSLETTEDCRVNLRVASGKEVEMIDIHQNTFGR